MYFWPFRAITQAKNNMVFLNQVNGDLGYHYSTHYDVLYIECYNSMHKLFAETDLALSTGGNQVDF